MYFSTFDKRIAMTVQYLRILLRAFFPHAQIAYCEPELWERYIRSEGGLVVLQDSTETGRFADGEGGIVAAVADFVTLQKKTTCCYIPSKQMS